MQTCVAMMMLSLASPQSSGAPDAAVWYNLTDRKREALSWSSIVDVGTSHRLTDIRVCIVYDSAHSEPATTQALTGLINSLVILLADVTVLNLDAASSPLSDHGRHVWLPQTKHTYDGSAAATASFRTIEWFRSLDLPFDHVVFHAEGGAAHYSLLAREQALALMNSRISLVVHVPRQLLWRRRASVVPPSAILPVTIACGRSDYSHPPRHLSHPTSCHLRTTLLGQGASLDELEEDHMQRAAASRADAVLAPQSSLRFIRSQGWRLPIDTVPWEERRGNPSARRRFDAHRDALEPVLKLWAAWARGLLPLPASMTASNRSSMPPLLEMPRAVEGTAAASSAGGLAGGRPLVSVCIVHHERGMLLLQALRSVRSQTLPPEQLQAVVVDDGSTSTESHAGLIEAGAWAEFAGVGRFAGPGRWLLLRRPSRYLGAARNEAARHATGAFLFFLDDDNALKPHALATLLGAAAASRSHILTCVNEKWPVLKPPPAVSELSERWLPLGDASELGVFRNCFGDASALVSRQAFEALGGFTEDGNVGHEDWELWARAVLHGFKLQVVPEALYWYRIGNAQGMLAESIGSNALAITQRHANHARNIRPYLLRLKGWPEAQDAVRLAQGMYERARDDESAVHIVRE